MRMHSRKWKEKELQELTQLADQYNVVAIADLTRFPASLFQEVRKKLKGKAIIRVSKTRIIKKALEESKQKNLLKEYAKKSCAIIFTTMNPFELFAFLKKNKGSMAAKEGVIAERDIIIPAGDTGLPPGPALSDLKQAGLSVRIVGSTIAVAEDKVVTKAGQPIAKAAASALTKLNIKPIKVGLNLIAAFEKGQVYKAVILDTDPEQVFNDFVLCHKRAFNLAYNIFYFTPATVQLFLQKAFKEAGAVALEAEFFSKETMPLLLLKASSQAVTLKQLVKEEVKEEKPKEKEAEEKEKAEEKEVKEEEKKEELKKEKPEEKVEEKKEEAKAGEKEKEEEKKVEEKVKEKEKVEKKEAKEEKPKEVKKEKAKKEKKKKERKR